MVLNFLNLYTLIIALFGKVARMVSSEQSSPPADFKENILIRFSLRQTIELESLRPNETALIASTVQPPYCSDLSVNCTILENYASYEGFKQNNAVLVFIANLTTLLPANELATSLAPNSTFISTTSSKINMSGKHAFS